MAIEARSRDTVTHRDGSWSELEADWVQARAGEQRTFGAVRSSRYPQGIASLAGCRASGKLRAMLRELFTDSAEQLGGHFLLLDDLAGASLVAGWGKLAWHGNAAEFTANAKAGGIGGEKSDMRGVCIGLAKGSAALDSDGFPRIENQSTAEVGDLVNPHDPDGWHVLAQTPGPGTRRARWIDVWRKGGKLHAHGGFQDSAAKATGGREAVHEYRFKLSVNEASGSIEGIEVIPHVLPYLECPAAILGLGKLIGRPVADLRFDVPVLFAREAGCTHLNDVLRALVCVPAQAKHIPEEGSE